MGKMIYGIDSSEEMTPEKVRDAMTECFYEAHCADSQLGGGAEVDKGYCSEIIKKGFTETGGDFENPTKESLMGVMGYLKEFSKNFRNPEVIEKHASDIMELMNKLP